MNLAIEYILRSDRIKSLLSFPCSLFLVKNDNGEKVVVTLTKSFRSDQVLAKHWKIDVIDDVLPPFAEYKVEKSEIFISPYVIVPDHALLRFQENPYPTGAKQYSDPPQNIFQDREYNDCLSNFYCPKSNMITRENWLWDAFEKLYVPKDIKSKYNTLNQVFQREYIFRHSKKTWKHWVQWRHCFLDYFGPAPELIFAKEYKDKYPKEIKCTDLYGYLSRSTTSTTADNILITPASSGYYPHDSVISLMATKYS